MARYKTVERTKSIDRTVDAACMVGIESVTAGAYCPAMEEKFCPSRQPTAMESRSYLADELTQDDALELEILADDASQDNSTVSWHPLTASEKETMTVAERYAHMQRNPATAFLRKGKKMK